ncbi:phosphoribosylamine--glycine ligase [Ligilactobacillus acidipiscis]|uniref:phosphoribosylamine--glycine ligase n=1 Tax=Ligilactobacillus acidipiscis TaxID=89059 RepID=UPI0023F82B14|nr:phosphoribosylamine--glycine ligase [Ligilactobacillus acidipiscis]WEV58147.1 phosphoribosylamine--glycine ligase [Ligilactobacillus acidipiscis]
MKNVLVIGSGAREHALGATFLRSPQVDRVYCAPGNPGMVQSGIRLVDIAENEFEELAEFVGQKEIALVFVGPEAPLADGIVDFLQERGVQVFGPAQSAARLESDKKFAKNFMLRNHVPTAAFATFSEYETALVYAQNLSFPLVIKENGLAGGKGVQIVTEETQLESALHKALNQDGQVLVEKYLAGEEFSLMVFMGGPEPVFLPISQDHKKIFAGENGPNTGGMGAYSPVPHITSQIVEEARQTIVAPTVAGLHKEGLEYAGTLYIGCMLTTRGIKVIEYNVRLGDPETQVLLPQLTSDFYTAVTDLIAGQTPVMEWQREEFYLGTVVAAPGYPIHPKQGLQLPQLPNNVFYAGVVSDGEHLLSSGGRIFALVEHAPTLKEAQSKVNATLERLALTEFYYRKDIGFRDL